MTRTGQPTASASPGTAPPRPGSLAAAILCAGLGMALLLPAAGAQAQPGRAARPAEPLEVGPPKSPPPGPRSGNGGNGGSGGNATASCPHGTPPRIATNPGEAELTPSLPVDRSICVRLARGQAAYFRIAPEAGGDYTVATSRLGRNADTVLAGLDARGRPVMEDDDGGGDDLSSLLEVDAASGVALIRVRMLEDQGGTFDLRLTRTAPRPQPNFATSQEQSASRPALEAGVTVHLNLRRNQAAYFALPADRTGLVAMTRNLRNRSDSVLALLDANGQVLMEDDDGGGGFASELAVSEPVQGAVTLRVTTLDNTPGEFDLVLLKEAPQPPAPFPTNLQAARDRGPLEAGTMSLDLSRRQSAVFALPPDQTLLLQTRNLRGETDTVLSLLDADGAVVGQDDDGGEGFASRILTSRGTRTAAFVRVGTLNGVGGSFDLVVRPMAARTSGPGSSAGIATTLEEAARRPTLLPGEAVLVQLEGNQAAIFGLPHDGSAAMALTFALADGADTVLELLDAEGEVIAENDDADGGLGSRLAVEPQPRPAYLRVKSIGRGSASFQLVLVRPAAE